ncbi:MAG: 50S ribosomal protein L25/general stress protein Ctc [Desulfobacterales bacterium]|nr:50S ribosomal protein L25/general stress protein Ctc [Desulfobacterales bacterium]
MEQISLDAQVRKTTGNGPARVLRRQGRVPAVLYGPKTEPILLSIDSREFDQILKKSSIGSVLLKLDIKNGQTGSRSAMVKELQTHPVTGQFLHVDFYEVDLKRKINAMVPVTTSGISQGVENGGILQIVRRELEVFCLPTAIPEAIDVDISELDIGESIHVNEIALPSDVELPEDVDFTVLTILAPKIEEEPVEEEELAEGEEVAEEAAEEAAEGDEAPAEEESKGE